MSRPELEALLAAAKAKVAAMTPEEVETMLQEQRESWVRGEMGIGLDADEAAYCAQTRRDGLLGSGPDTPRPDFIQKPGDIRRHACTAHIPGTGPAERRCIECANLHQTKAGRRRKRGRCLAWAEMRGIAERFEHTENQGWWFGLPTISGDTAACKYFSEKEVAP